MEAVIVATLIALGIALLLIDILVIPGTFFLGIGGVIALGFSVYFTFTRFEPALGWSILLGSLLVLTALIMVAVRTKVYRRITLEKISDSRVIENEYHDLKVGDSGKAVSALRPRGKARFDSDVETEVSSLGEMIDTGTEIVVTQLTEGTIYVEAREG